MVKKTTSSEKTEQELKHIQESLQAILDSSLYIVQAFKAIRNKSGKIVDFVWVMNNKKAIEQNGEVIGKSLLQQNPGVTASGLFKQFVQVTETGVVVDQEVYYNHEQFDGWFHQMLVKMGDGFVMNTEDITEKKKAEQEILRLKDELAQKAKFQLQAVLESISDGFVTYDKEWRYTYVNKKAAEITGMKREELIGKSIYELFPERVKTPIFKKFQALAKKGKPTEFEYFSPGAKRWLHTRFYPSDEGVTTFITDITGKRKVEENDRYLATLTNNIMDAVISTDEKYRIVTWNKGAEELYQWKESEVIGKYTKKVLFTEFRNLDEQNTVDIQLRTKKVWKGEVTQRKKNGVKVDILATVAGIRNTKGKITGYVAVNRDISERKQLERQKDDFVGIASHELRTPVTSLKIFSDVLEQRFHKRGDKNNAQVVNKMKAQINKLATLINDLLDVTRIESGKLQLRESLFAFDALLEEVIEEIQRTTDTHVISQQGKSNKKIYGDRERTEQVISNLLTNAIKYSPKKTKIILGVKVIKNEIIVSVQDFGIGIADTKQHKVFERFYRETGEEEITFPGLGMGLYVASEIIKRQGGRIWVESKKGNGSTFYFSLPIKRDK